MNKLQKVYAQYEKDAKEHAENCKHDDYYRHCYGGGKVPSPSCEYCVYFEDPYCMREVNNNDITNVLYREEFERDYEDVCEYYEWDGEWEEE